MLLTIFSLNILSNPPNCSSARRSVFSILFLQSYKKAVDEVSDICPLHPISAFFSLIYCPIHLFLTSSISIINISRFVSFLNSLLIFLSFALLQSSRRRVSHYHSPHSSPSHQFVTVFHSVRNPSRHRLVFTVA